MGGRSKGVGADKVNECSGEEVKGREPAEGQNRAKGGGTGSRGAGSGVDKCFVQYC